MNDVSNIHPVPIQKTLLLINNFVLNTTSFLNNFTDVCEKKLSGVSGKLSELEILLAVLEAKLDSIPGIDDVVAAVPSSSAPAADSATTAPTATPSISSSEPVAPVSAPATADNGMVAVKDHPDYKPFAKLLKVGVPLQAAKNKLSAAGLDLDPEMLNDPDQMIPVVRATSTLLVVAGGSADETDENSMALAVVD